MSLKSDLMRPDAYRALDVRALRIDCAETHASWVFLLDDDVFKVKRPVDLGFLDFRSVEHRKRACDAEVHLNQRLAPGVYRGVVPVRRDEDGRCIVGGHGEVVDWAVHMARLPDSRRADRRLEQGRLSIEDLAAIAARIATFHAEARSDAETSSYGTPTRIRSNVEENFAQTRAWIGRYLDADEAADVERRQRTFIEANRAVFEQRLRNGRVRDGHGDLRLEHIYMGSPACSAALTVIDCIEFSDRFRFADVASDVAFLAMDLMAHGRVDLAERFIADYARASNDFDLYTLVDFYVGYRAFVRGKVSAVLAGDDDASAGARRRAEADARRHFRLAVATERKSLLSPAVVAVGGTIASGKSTVAERLAGELSAPIVDADRTRKSMIGVEEHHAIRAEAFRGAYSQSFTDAVYREVLRRAEVVLRSGRPVVVDASFRTASMREAVRSLAREYDVPFRFVECRATPATCRQRLVMRERGASVSDGRLEIFDAFSAKFEAVNELSGAEYIVLDTDLPLDRSVQVLRSRMSTWPPRLVI